jgi:ubiquinone/menaquinone biosynthesis C-methylase UbiE
MSELDAIAARYERRKAAIPGGLYDPLLPANIAIRQERERVQSALVQRWLAGRSLGDMTLCEIGCGGGGNLIQLMQMGADPAKMIANELLPDRVEIARAHLPASVTFHPGDAREMPLADGSLDLIILSTVFSSILDVDMRQSIAAHVERWLKPGGAVLWYDFTFDNPRNPDVGKMPLAEVKALFPGCDVMARRTTLAPPLARKLPWAYRLLNLLPLLRTHICALIVKR